MTEDEIEVGQLALTVVSTPGHTRGHIALWDKTNGAAVCGRHGGWSWHHHRCAPRRGNMSAYMRSLERLLGLKLELMIPSHGDVFIDHEVGEQLQGYIRHRNMRGREGSGCPVRRGPKRSIRARSRLLSRTQPHCTIRWPSRVSPPICSSSKPSSSPDARGASGSKWVDGVRGLTAERAGGYIQCAMSLDLLNQPPSWTPISRHVP